MVASCAIHTGRCIIVLWHWDSHHIWMHMLRPLLWRHNGHDGVSNHQPHHCLLNRSFGRRSKKTSKLCVTGPCEGNSSVTGEFPAQMASDAKNVSIWWRHHAGTYPCPVCHDVAQSGCAFLDELALHPNNRKIVSMSTDLRPCRIWEMVNNHTKHEFLQSSDQVNFFIQEYMHVKVSTLLLYWNLCGTKRRSVNLLIRCTLSNKIIYTNFYRLSRYVCWAVNVPLPLTNSVQLAVSGSYKSCDLAKNVYVQQCYCLTYSYNIIVPYSPGCINTLFTCQTLITLITESFLSFGQITLTTHNWHIPVPVSGGYFFEVRAHVKTNLRRSRSRPRRYCWITR